MKFTPYGCACPRPCNGARGSSHTERTRDRARKSERKRDPHQHHVVRGWRDGDLCFVEWGRSKGGKRRGKRPASGTRLKAQGSGISPVDKVNRDVAGLAVQPELLGDLDHLASPPTATVSGPSSSGAWPCSADHRGPSPPAPRGRPAGKHGRGARSGGGIGRDRQRSLQRGRQRIARREG